MVERAEIFGTMTSKSKLAEEIQALQANASAICRACTLRLSPKCWGPACADIIRIVNQIDPKVSEYFRLELAEKQQQKRNTVGHPVWQRYLPLQLWEDPQAGAAESAAAAEEALISAKRKQENDVELDMVVPPEGWGYSLLQFVLGWETSTNVLSPGAAAGATALSETYEEISCSQGSPPVQKSRKRVVKRYKAEQPLRVVGTKLIG